MRFEKDQLLIHRVLGGDTTAFDTLYEMYHAQVYAMVAGRVADRDAVDDLVQVTFMRAFRSLGRFRGQAAFSTWLVQIALNACISCHRTQRVRQNWVQQVEDVEALPVGNREVPWHENPERAFIQNERLTLVIRSIRALPAVYRRAMWLRYVDEWSYEEIMDALDLPMGTVKTRLNRGRRRLEGTFRRLGLFAM